MKIVRQVQLFLQEGNSDKVYEIDLCEVSAGQFVVNFRYGRRGTTLRDGTKTTLPVEQKAAIKLFDALEAEKRGKGYRSAGEASAAAAPRGRTKGKNGAAGREAAAAAVLARFDAKLKDDDLDRLIWRCGERRLQAAVPRLLALVPAARQPRRRYCLAWALGRIGDPAALPALISLGEGDTPAAALARQSRQLLLDGEQRAREAAAVLAAAPPAVARPLEAGDLAAAAAQFQEQFVASFVRALPELYLADVEPALRRLLLAVAARVPLDAPYFRGVRRLYKAAELRCDAELFGLLARRFEKERAKFAVLWSNRYENGGWIEARKEVVKENGRVGFVGSTRKYLRRRVARVLRKLGELADPAFVPMATGLLLAYTDADAGQDRSTSTYDWENERRVTHHYARWHAYFSFCWVLYRHSPRYRQRKGNLGWVGQRNYQPGKPPPAVREEAFPELWDAAPEALLHLLETSACEPVHEFAAKALGQQPLFGAALPLETLGRLLRRPYAPTWSLALRWAVDRWDAARPDAALAGLLLASPGLPARRQGLDWLAAALALWDDPALVADLLLSPYPEPRAALQARWQVASPANAAGARALLETLLDRLAALRPEEPAAAEVAADAQTTLLAAFSPLFAGIDRGRVLRLLEHPLVGLQVLAARIVGEHLPTETIDAELLHRLLDAEAPGVRAMGVALLGRLPLRAIPGVEEMVLAFCLARDTEIRQAARRPLARIQAEAPELAAGLLMALVTRLQRADRPEGLHRDLEPLLLETLAPSLDRLGPEVALRLLGAKSPVAHRVGLALLDRADGWPELSLRDLARLAQHETLDVRERAWSTLEAAPERARGEAAELVPALDGPFADARERGFRFFRGALGEGDWDPVLLVALCDAVQPDVRAFGREMIQRHFDQDAGATYLERLAQHPELDILFFTSGLLATHGAGRPELLPRLELYFRRVLGQVYRGRAAKSRVLSFLHTEALRDEAAARFVLPLLEELALVMAIGDRAAAVRALRDIRLRFPDLPGLLSARPPLRRTG